MEEQITSFFGFVRIETKSTQQRRSRPSSNEIAEEYEM
ncbi:hypothetical protein TC41_0195 [Alicyclobacillus acidocaldarius subsp. acidocaldarius Tc-4-1]|uniref:Uncharacterized protein n=1 Tax=Alicyclobacillus acidocaldarius (strain Tc-4-1) TaxID=1048834 RepID=F8IJ22_ALIAT|nr:hypothetical protein TC41_0195 [Alicyclobacillus acidocaldarius subsp. acidocaldarius Tc-4-1]